MSEPEDSRLGMVVDERVFMRNLRPPSGALGLTEPWIVRDQLSSEAGRLTLGGHIPEAEIPPLAEGDDLQG